MEKITVDENVAKWLRHQKNYIEMFTDMQASTDLSDADFESMVEIDKKLTLLLHESIYHCTQQTERTGDSVKEQ